MDPATQFSLVDLAESSQNELGLFPRASVLGILRLILAGSPLSEVLTIIAQLVESQAKARFARFGFPMKTGKQLHCAAAPSLPGFSADVGPMLVGPKGASCGTAVYRREPVYVTDILSDPIWDDYRDRMSALWNSFRLVASPVHERRESPRHFCHPLS